MYKSGWRQRSLIERVRWLRFFLPPMLVVVVIAYQLGVTQTLEANFGHVVHYGMEIIFYSLTGPMVTWLMLVWVERRLTHQVLLEKQVQALEHEKAAVLNEERVRIARDLHDGVAQTLYFLALKTDVLRQQLAGDESTVSELREMGQTTRHIIRDVRRTIFAIQPLDWSEIGFLPGLEQFIRQFAEQNSWQAIIHLDQSHLIPTRLEPTIFRFVQESLNNVAKHAEATEITVSIVPSQKDQITLTVQDNGRGFDVENTNGAGLGLQQMSARVTTVDGRFDIASTPVSGTIVTAVLPTNGVHHD